MTALDTWLLLAKITLFLELIEYAIVLHIRYSNATLSYPTKKRKHRKTKVSEEIRSDEEVDKLITSKCKKVDSWAFLGFLLGSILINFAYFTIYR